MKLVIKRGRLPLRRYRVLFVADNGEPIMASEGYNRRTDAVHAAVLVRRGAGEATIDDRSGHP